MLPEFNARSVFSSGFLRLQFYSTNWTWQKGLGVRTTPALRRGCSSLMWENDLNKAFPEDTASCAMDERRGLVTERCLIHKSTDTISFLNFWPDLKCLLCSCTSHAFCDMQGFVSAGLLILLLLFWPYASLGAGFVLCCWLLSNKIVLQDTTEVQERCRAHLGKNQH